MFFFFVFHTDEPASESEQILETVVLVILPRLPNPALAIYELLVPTCMVVVIKYSTGMGIASREVTELNPNRSYYWAHRRYTVFYHGCSSKIVLHICSFTGKAMHSASWFFFGKGAKCALGKFEWFRLPNRKMGLDAHVLTSHLHFLN